MRDDIEYDGIEIISSPLKVDPTELDKMRARLDAIVCPYCGENRKFHINENNQCIGVDGGGITETTWVRGRFFKNGKFYTPPHFIYRYVCKCYTCGTRWKTRPFRSRD